MPLQNLDRNNRAFSLGSAPATGSGPHVDHFAGIRYQSRLDDATLNWAIFEPDAGSPELLRQPTVERVDPSDPDVARALAVLGLRVG